MISLNPQAEGDLEGSQISVSSPNSATPNFLSNVDQTIKNNIGTSLSAPLRANPIDIGFAGIEPNRSTEISLTEIALAQSSSSEISLAEDSLTKLSLEHFSLAEVNSFQIGFDETSREYSGLTPIAPSQIRPFKTHSIQARVPEDSSFQVGLLDIDVANLGRREIDFSQIGSIKVDMDQMGFTENGSTKVDSLPILAAFSILQTIDFNSTEISLPSGIALQQFLTGYQRTLHSPTLQTGTTPWTNFLQGSTPFNLNLEITNLPTGQLAEATLTHFDANGLPIGGTITIDDDANGLDWFVDETPWEHSEFNLPQTETLLRATPGSAAYGRYDLLTTILHELGHLAGIIHGNPAYDDRIQYINGSPTFIGNGYEAQLTNDLSHLADPTQLMSPYLAPGVRKLPSQLELQILADIRSNLSGRLPTATEISAAETAQPMQGITNGEFDELLANWQRQGDTSTENGQAILREDDPRLASLSQNFLVPEGGSNILRFDLLETTLGSTDRRPPDAFEIALFNSQTLDPIGGSLTGLTHTDAIYQPPDFGIRDEFCRDMALPCPPQSQRPNNRIGLKWCVLLRRNGTLRDRSSASAQQIAPSASTTSASATPTAPRLVIETALATAS